VRDHLGEEKGGARVKLTVGGGMEAAARSGNGSVTGMDGRRRGRRGVVLTWPMRKRMGEERERGHGRQHRPF
jgi:hypothetical protein